MREPRLCGLFELFKKKFGIANGEFTSSLFMAFFIAKAKVMITEVKASTLVKGSAGVRAQAIDPLGKLLMDFNVECEGNQIHESNAISSGVTSSLAIATYLINICLTDLQSKMIHE